MQSFSQTDSRAETHPARPISISSGKRLSRFFICSDVQVFDSGKIEIGKGNELLHVSWK